MYAVPNLRSRDMRLDGDDRLIDERPHQLDLFAAERRDRFRRQNNDAYKKRHSE
jgi:hypothetical protein